MESEELGNVIEECEVVSEWFNLISDGDTPASTSEILKLLRELKKVGEEKKNGKKRDNKRSK